MTVAEIVALGRYSYTNWLAKLEQTDKIKILDSLKKVGLETFQKRKLNTLSDGEKQRVFIAKGLASEAPVMLLDEPTAHLDIPNKVNILSLLRRLTREYNRSVLVATHELELALKLADEVWLLMPDQTIFRSTPEELVSSGRLDQVFGNELLSFNAHSGNFTLNSKSLGSVSVTGEGALADLSVQAFRRIGYTTDTYTVSNSVRVHIKGKHWILGHKGERIESDTLAETCRLLRKIGK
jgi:iron complex transport system ATP-binding protein